MYAVCAWRLFSARVETEGSCVAALAESAMLGYPGCSISYSGSWCGCGCVLVLLTVAGFKMGVYPTW